MNQLLELYPLHFEFSGYFLGTLAYHAHSARFGTFLHDCESERQKAHQVVAGGYRVSIVLQSSLTLARSLSLLETRLAVVVVVSRSRPRGIASVLQLSVQANYVSRGRDPPGRGLRGPANVRFGPGRVRICF